MNLGSVIVAVMAMVLGVGVIAIVSEHFQKMARIRAQGRGATNDAVMRAIEDLRREVSGLRDTTTQFDVSFDTALQRLEGSVVQLDRRVSAVEQNQAHAHRS